jgi:hypothetical protein
MLSAEKAISTSRSVFNKTVRRFALIKSGGRRGRPVSASLISSDTSIEAALQPLKLFERIHEGRCEIGSRFAVQSLSRFAVQSPLLGLAVHQRPHCAGSV